MCSSSKAMTPGSSPLARGLPTSDQWDEFLTRIIPARAGFTTGPPLSRNQGTDHPRSRGVYKGRFVEIPKENGSSPLARGLPQ